jgi:hypothetical protein
MGPSGSYCAHADSEKNKKANADKIRREIKKTNNMNLSEISYSI